MIELWGLSTAQSFQSFETFDLDSSVMMRCTPRGRRERAANMLLDFALWLVLERPSGRRISACSAAKYVSQAERTMGNLISAVV